MNQSQKIALRKEWQNFDSKEILSFFENFNVKVELKNWTNKHYKITGKSRVVELYATTGTVNAIPNDKYGSINCKNMSPKRALERALSIAQHGH